MSCLLGRHGGPAAGRTTAATSAGQVIASECGTCSRTTPIPLKMKLHRPMPPMRLRSRGWAGEADDVEMRMGGRKQRGSTGQLVRSVGERETDETHVRTWERRGPSAGA